MSAPVSTSLCSASPPEIRSVGRAMASAFAGWLPRAFSALIPLGERLSSRRASATKASRVVGSVKASGSRWPRLEAEAENQGSFPSNGTRGPPPSAGFSSTSRSMLSA